VDFKTLYHRKKIATNDKIYPGNSSERFFHLNEDGSLEIQGEIFSDPDAAMAHFIGTSTRQKLDGWRFWRVFDQERCELVPLEHLRASIKSENQLDIKTSDTHPLRFDPINWPNSSAQIGLTICPGKQGRGLYSGVWKRDLQKDLDSITQWPATSLITLMQSHEFSLLNIQDFEATATQQPFDWLYLPIEDMHVPDALWLEEWRMHSQSLRQTLDSNQNIVIHCRGGLGRTGMVAALLLIDNGMGNRRAIDLVRQARPGAIETYEQEQFVLSYQ